MSLIKHKKVNLVFPNNATASPQEIISIIKDAEKDRFTLSEQVKQGLKKWSKKYSQEIEIRIYNI
jgi:hypothetical protein